MRRYVHKIKSELTPEHLYRVMTDISRWPEWDSSLTEARLKGPVFHGVHFKLKRKGRLGLDMLIETADSPVRFVVVAIMVFSRLRTAREFRASGAGSEISTVIELWGPLAFLWAGVAARREQRRCDALTRDFLVYAAAV
jgi:hypothetical protein